MHVLHMEAPSWSPAHLTTTAVSHSEHPHSFKDDQWCSPEARLTVTEPRLTSTRILLFLQR